MKTAKILSPTLMAAKDCLTKNARSIFEEAIKNRSITTNQISQLIAPKYKTGKKFIQAMNLLTEIFQNNGIFVTYLSEKISGKTIEVKNNVPSFEKPEVNLPEYVLTPLEAELNMRVLKNPLHHKILSKDESYRLIALAQQGSIVARNLIMTHNQKLIVMIASRYKSLNILELEDLVQEGNFGLIKAIEKFDLSLDLSFSTYAFQWVRQAVTKAIMDYDHTVRIPVYVQELLRKSKKALERAMQDIDTIPDNAVNMSWLRMDPVSLDKSLSNSYSDSDLSLHEVLPDTSDIAGEIKTEADKDLYRRVKNFEKLVVSVTMLPTAEKNKKMFYMRYGINGEDDEMTLQSIGNVFGISRERVRQIIVKIWSDLRILGLEITEDCIGEDLRVIFVLEKIVHKKVKI